MNVRTNFTVKKKYMTEEKNTWRREVNTPTQTLYHSSKYTIHWGFSYGSEALKLIMFTPPKKNPPKKTHPTTSKPKTQQKQKLHTCTHAHTHTYACTHTHTYACTHTHTQTHTWERERERPKTETKESWWWGEASSQDSYTLDADLYTGSEPELK